ncbi:hypothetical protein E3N88_23489 [Mikania micrantha]|uniref:Fungal lipase-type domain-containing protein n=1 Tax=Mikania micrantha TaxID=192012 RepID=A0A5N6NG33_9ASTR|nr:hypothetical protein E3N88_23489 [Mikania micrantha]
MAGAENVWLAGHSLGASIAMLAGRELAKSGLYLETYLFSPPFNSVPIENLIKNQTLKRVVRIWASIIKAGIAIIVKRPSEDLEEDAFIMLSEWKPNMFVNPKDPICSEYIGVSADPQKTLLCLLMTTVIDTSPRRCILLHRL